MAGFFSKDDILASAFAGDPRWPAFYGKLLWVVLSLAALGTAFYMFRLYFVVFHGENRASEEIKAHIHESPRVMTGPLVVLALGAVFLGFLGVPAALGEPVHFENFWQQWFSAGTFPEVHEAGGGTVLGLMGIATALALVGIGGAWALYRNGPEGAAGVARALGPVLTFVQNKFYVDELYDFILVRPFRWIARRTFELIDRLLIDGLLVGGWGFIVSVIGRLARALQNGDVQRYLILMMVGLAAMFYFTTRPKEDFSFKTGEGTTVRFRADLGDGAVKRGAHAEWDFDGDGKVDATGQDAIWTFNAPGRYAVTLKVTDLFGRTEVVNHSVEVK